MRFTKTKSGTGRNKRHAKRELGAHQQSRKLRKEAAPEPRGGPDDALESPEVTTAKRIRSEQQQKDASAPPRGQKRSGDGCEMDTPKVRLRFDASGGGTPWREAHATPADAPAWWVEQHGVVEGDPL